MSNPSLRAAVALFTLAVACSAPALAATPKDTLVIVSEQGPNGLDTMVPTANDHSRMVAWHVYDRLVSHGEKTLPNGAISYDATVMKPELAERWEISPDNKVYTFFLRKDATFHDGKPVTAADVKWSFDRAVARRRFPGDPDGRQFVRQPGEVLGGGQAHLPHHAGQAQQARDARTWWCRCR